MLHFFVSSRVIYFIAEWFLLTNTITIFVYCMPVLVATLCTVLPEESQSGTGAVVLCRDTGARCSLLGASPLSLTTQPSLRGPETSRIFAGSPPTSLPLLGSVGAALPLNVLLGSSGGVGMLLLLVLCCLRCRLMTGEGGGGPGGWLERVKYSRPSNPHHK